MMIRTYNQLIQSETIESPLPLSLSEKFKKHQELQSQMEELKVKIQEETEGSPEESVEVMAIRSEIMQVEDEVNLHKNHLVKIEEIHQDKLDPMEYLHIPPIRDFGQVSQLGNILEQLNPCDSIKLLISLPAMKSKKTFLPPAKTWKSR